jgi:fumarate reductase (CoM/CoB) subunit A
MWQGAGIFRNAASLQRTLDVVRRLSVEKIRAQTSRNLVECCIVGNMCLTASLICRSALNRPESRGAHMRTDITQTWDSQHSPFGHTYVSREHEGIEKREVPA